MAASPVLYVYYPPLNDDSYPGVPNRHITEADWARFSLSQRRTVENATTQEGYTRRKVWVHRDLVDETEQERADREAAEQAARDAYERGQSIVRWRDFEPLVPGPGEVIVGSADGPVAVDASTVGGDVDPELVEQRVSEELQGRNLLEGPALIPPSLILSPAGSEDANGTIAPAVTGSPTTTTGRYGPAWRYTAPAQYFTTPNNGYITRNAGTVIVRATFPTPLASGQNQYIFRLTGGSNVFKIGLSRSSTSAKANYLSATLGLPEAPIQSEANAIPDNTPVTVALAWADGNAAIFVDGAEVGAGSFTPGSADATTVYTTFTGAGYPFDQESVLLFAERVPDNEIARISRMNSAHTIGTGWSSGDLVLPSQRTVIGKNGGSTLALRSPDNTLVDLAVSDTGTLLVGGEEVGGTPATPTGPLTITKAGDSHTIATTLKGVGTLAIETTAHGGGNGVFNFTRTTLDGVTIHANSDDAAPVRFSSAVGANHGYTSVRAYTVSGHEKTTADLGSVYTDGSREYTLLAISGNVLTFGYPYTVNGAGVTVAGTTAPAATLTHVSGGTNTANVPITSVASSVNQLYPSTTTPDVRYVLDGTEITADGDHRGSVLQVMESYTILDYKGIIDWARANVGQSFADNRDAIDGALRISNLYTFREGGRCTLSTSLAAVRPVTLGNTGIIQSFKLDEDAGTLWRYMPGVVAKSGIDFASPVNMTTYSTNITYTPADSLDAERPPSRYVDWLQSGSAKIIGFTAGYITDKTNTKDSDRADLSATWDMRGTKKVYPVAFSGVTLQPGDHRNAEAFRNYVAPHPSGATLVNVVEDAQAAYVHIDFHQSVTGQAIPLPDHIGKSVTVLDSDGLTVENDTVDASGLTVTVPGTAGRAVVKLT